MNRLAPRIAVGLCFAAASLAAHAQLQLSCPVRWDFLNALFGDPDKLLYGVKVRDWKSEYFDAMQRKHEECMTKANYPESLKQAERINVTNTLNQRDWYFKKRDEQVRAADVLSATAQAVDNANKQGVDIVVDKSSGWPAAISLYQFNGAPFPVEQKWECKDSGGWKKIGWLNEASIKTLAYYTDICLTSGAIDQAAAMAVKTDLDALTRFYAAIPAFAKRVESVAARADGVNASTLAELDTAYRQLLAPVQRVSFAQSYQHYHPQWQGVVETLNKLHTQITRNTCDTDYTRAKLPSAWRSAYYLLDWNSPTEFRAMVCDAMGKGAQIRYLSGGLFSKEGLEIKSKTRTVQVFPEARRIAGGDPKIPLLVPTSVKIDGKSYAITTQNLRSLYVELVTALQNQ